ncbi:hypothetical protein [Bizionia paragorgiae]|uniref:Uncharacterized protein n=1 Tax=Bizionia paragorgiae TaxID=283786 RepID=A0A1H3VUU0_BIZPA|nr:hypothetical protein [Bizionia paragorgiae]SDZ77882.1 hypothetical protein SAMN04487990_10217 [Bizionia paragorgiae]
MKQVKIIVVMLFLAVFNFGFAQEVWHKNDVYLVSKGAIFKGGVDVTETLSEADKKAVFSQFKADEKLRKKNERALAKSQKEAKAAKKSLRQSEKALKKQEKLVRAKEKAQANLQRAESKLAKEQKKFDRLKRKDKLTPESTIKYEKNLLNLKHKVQRAQMKLKDI